MRLLQGSLVALCLISTAMAIPATEDEQALRAVSQGAEQFSAALFDEIVSQHKGNLISSPFSAGVVLSMAAYGAGGETEKQLKSVLHLPSPDTVGTAGFQSLIDKLNNVKDVELRLANKIFTADKFSIKPEYLQLTENFFRSTSQSVNFTKNTEAAATINTWVQQQTNNKISDIVEASDLDSMTAMILVNAVYFKGQWKEKFDPKFTEDKPFYVDEQTVKNVPTMYRQGNYKYGELPELNASFIEILYKGDELSMVIILPDEINGLAELEKKLKTTTLTSILNQGYTREVKLSLPKFKIESKIPLDESLKKMGLENMFSDQADFSHIADAKLAISKVVQKAFIEVNEEGSEAAAATELAITCCSLLKPTIIVDRPFVYNIVKVTKIRGERGITREVMPLFTGHVTEPKI